MQERHVVDDVAVEDIKIAAEREAVADEPRYDATLLAGICGAIAVVVLAWLLLRMTGVLG